MFRAPQAAARVIYDTTVVMGIGHKQSLDCIPARIETTLACRRVECWAGGHAKRAHRQDRRPDLQAYPPEDGRLIRSLLLHVVLEGFLHLFLSYDHESDKCN
jgi:hypothetical protein